MAPPSGGVVKCTTGADRGIQLAGPAAGAGLGAVEGMIRLLALPSEPTQSPVFTALPVNLILQSAPLVHQVAPPPKAKAKRRKKPSHSKDPNSFNEKYRRLMAKMEQPQLAPPVAQEGKDTQPCAGYSGGVGPVMGCSQEQLFGGYHDNSTPTSVTPEEMYGDPHQWAAGSLLPFPDTWLAVSPPIMCVCVCV